MIQNNITRTGTKMYKVGDKVTFPKIRPLTFNKKGRMDFLLGKTYIVDEVYTFINGKDQRLMFSEQETKSWNILASDTIGKHELVRDIIKDL